MVVWLRHKIDTKTSSSWHKRATMAMPETLCLPDRSPLPARRTARYFASGQGPWIEDVDGNRYIDLTGGGGAMILGFDAPRVTEAIRQTATLGLGMGANTPHSVLLAEQLRQRLGPVDRVRFTTGHGSATELAIRLAKHRTGRSDVVVFAGCLHGDVPGLLAASDPTDTTMPALDRSRAAAPGGGAVIVLPYGDVSALSAAFAAKPDEIACVLVEPAPTHMGVVVPPIGFNAQLAKLCREHQTLLILDETVTGFRASASGMFGLVGPLEGWEPDLMVLGGVIGGGLPIGAVGGGAIMDLLADGGSVDHADGESCSPLACAAGLATLAGCDADLYQHLEETSAALQELIAQELDAAGLAHAVQGIAGMFSVSFGDGQVHNLAEARTKKLDRYRVFAGAMLEGGVRVPPSPFGAWLVSGAHDATALEHIAAALPGAARVAAKATRAD